MGYQVVSLLQPLFSFPLFAAETRPCAMLLTPVAPFAADLPVYPSGLRPAAGAAPSTATTPVPPPATALRSGAFAKGTLSIPRRLSTPKNADRLYEYLLKFGTRHLNGQAPDHQIRLNGQITKDKFRNELTFRMDVVADPYESSRSGERIPSNQKNKDIKKLIVGTIRFKAPSKRPLIHPERTGVLGSLSRFLMRFPRFAEHQWPYTITVNDQNRLRLGLADNREFTASALQHKLNEYASTLLVDWSLVKPSSSKGSNPPPPPPSLPPVI
jgi:hypothetical protein